MWEAPPMSSPRFPTEVSLLLEEAKSLRHFFFFFRLLRLPMRITRRVSCLLQRAVLGMRVTIALRCSPAAPCAVVASCLPEGRFSEEASWRSPPTVLWHTMMPCYSEGELSSAPALRASAAARRR